MDSTQTLNQEQIDIAKQYVKDYEELLKNPRYTPTQAMKTRYEEEKKVAGESPTPPPDSESTDGSLVWQCYAMPWIIWGDPMGHVQASGVQVASFSTTGSPYSHRNKPVPFQIIRLEGKEITHDPISVNGEKWQGFFENMWQEYFGGTD